MAVKKIITTPDPVLTTPTEKVAKIDDKIQQILTDLLDTLHETKNPEGAGIAAPQIGVSKRICIVRQFFPHPENPHEVFAKEHVLINPKIVSFSKDTEIDFEGCLSIPDCYGQVERSLKIKVRAQDETGKDIKLNASGFFSRIIQHEIDHLDGILFTSKLIGKSLTENELDKLIEEDEQAGVF